MKAEYKKYGFGAIVIALTILSLLYMVTGKSGGYEVTTSEIAEEIEPEQVEILETDIEEIANEIWEEGEEESEALGVVEPVEIQQIPIYVCGAVNQPDVYYLDETAIIKEAIMVAGGFTEDADQEVWNLAMEIQKGEKIYVPKVGEEIDKTSNSYDNREGMSEPSSESLGEPVNVGHGLININQANAQQLSTLPGIGPAISQNIIDYRDSNGGFKNLQDVTNVSRIGAKTLEKIKDHICFQ